MVPAMGQSEVPVQSCPDCAAQMPGGARFCPACGRSMLVIERAQGRVGRLKENTAAALSYFTVLAAVFFLFVDPYRKNFFVKFHACQCVLFTGAAILLGLILWLAGLGLFLIPVVGPLLVVIIAVVAGLASFFAWLVLVVKAFQGEMFQLPGIGWLAGRYAGLL